MSDDLADLFDPARRRPSVPGGLPPRDLAEVRPRSWQDAERRRQLQEWDLFGPPATSVTDGGSSDDVAQPDSEDGRGDDAQASSRWTSFFRRSGDGGDDDLDVTTYSVDRPRKALKPKLIGSTGHITYSKSQAIAWFYQEPGAWTMRQNSRQRALIDNEARVLARLADLGIKDLHRRTVRTTWPVHRWARQHNEWADPLPDVAGALGWDEYLAGQQAALLYDHPTHKMRFWGIYLPPRPWMSRRIETVASWVGDSNGPFGLFARVRDYADQVAETEFAQERDLLTNIARIMDSQGVHGVPIRPGQLDYLLRRSASIGLPLQAPPDDAHNIATGDWSPTDVAALADLADLAVEPGDGYVRVSGTVNGRKHVGYVTVVTVGRMGTLPIPESMLPWQVIGESVNPALEWSERIRLLDTETARKKMDGQAKKIESQWNHYTQEHDEDPPQALREQYRRSKQVVHEAEHDQTGFVARTWGWWRIAVVGASPDAVRDNVADLEEAYAPTIKLEVEDGQLQLLREFLPCEPLANTANMRRMPVRTAAAGMGAVGDRIGDITGIHIGQTASISRRPAIWDLFAAMEQFNRSGLTPIVGGLGSGKTMQAAIMTYEAVRAGAHGVILDPSGPLARMKNISELAPYTRVYPLTGSRSRPGALNPYQVIHDPNPNDEDYLPENPDFDGEPNRTAAARARWEADMRAAEALRISTVITVFMMMLPVSTREQSWTNYVIQTAASAIGGDRLHSPSEVIEQIGAMTSDEALDPSIRTTAQLVHAELNRMRALPDARVLFPQNGEIIDDDPRQDRLTILTMPGLSLPPEHTPEDQWSSEQRMAGPLIHLAAWLANRMIYELPRWVRKILFLDENKYLQETGAGRTLNQRVARDTRKFNVRALVVSQLPQDFLGLDNSGAGDQSALIYEVFIGDLGANAQAISGALKLLNLPDGQGYEGVLASIGSIEEQTHDEEVRARRQEGEQPRQFIVKMGDDIEVITADWSHYTHLAHVFEILRSDPTASRSSWLTSQPAESEVAS